VYQHGKQVHTDLPERPPVDRLADRATPPRAALEQRAAAIGELMNIPEEFGNYLLLKKLREDALGETFRAGRVGRDGIEQVVLLRVFNGQGVDGERLWQKISARGVVQQALRSPNIGSGVDLGKVRSFPYAAYDYISGKNLATLFAQAARLRQAIPVEHALLVCERVALALAAAYETRIQDERVLHGFVVPHLVMISNEGEARLLGFEVAPGLRELWLNGWRADDVRGYIAPEAAGAAAPGRSDDVYSLGALLFELLSSERLPAEPAGGYGPLIDAMQLPNEGTPLPPAIAALLKKSLVPRDQRVPDAITWHKTISKLTIDGQYSSTTFNLAFFMHSLFRDEIDRENQEIEAEKKLELPRRQAPAGGAGLGAAAAPAAAGAAALAAGAGAVPSGDMRERTGVRDAAWAAGSTAPTGSAAAAGANRTPLYIGIAAGAVAVLGIAGFLLFGRSGTSSTKPVTQPPGATAGGAAAAPGGAGDAAANAAALQAQIQQMIEARSKDMESKLKNQYDDQIKQLQGRLDESRKAAAEQEREKARSERQAALNGDSPAALAATGAEGRQGRSESAAPPTPHTAAPPPNPAAAAAATTPPSTGTAAAPVTPPTPAPTAAEPVAAAAGHQPQIQPGDLVPPGPDVVSPKLISRPDAHYPPAAKRMNRRAEVVVRVLVDEKGRVQQAERVGDPVGLGFDDAAIDVARRSLYVPAVKEGIRVKFWTTMKVTFVPPSG
jgi:TonB family protein